MLLYALIPGLPLLAFLVIALGGRRLARRSHLVGIPAVWLSFLLSLVACWDVWRQGPGEVALYTLFRSGELAVHVSLYLDQLTVLLLLLVTGVSALVHAYSSRYMQGDPRFPRFFAVIALFTFAMVMVVMSSSLLVLYLFWEVMGLCSYLLISHWADRRTACAAATRAFLVNAVADVGFGLGVILTYLTFGTLHIPDILAAAPAKAAETVTLLSWGDMNVQVSTMTLIGLLLFSGAMGKSAQVPFHVWLPFAMEAPTPVSALIHAATMVNAGVFLLARMSPLYLLTPTAMIVVAGIGALTALFAATVALTQSDIKRILAYSTMSQIGFMVMTCGVGAYVAAIFHLLAHGAFKAFLFLSTGRALQAVEPGHGGETGSPSHTRTVRERRTLIAASLVLSCVPPFIIFSDAYESLWTTVYPASAHYALWVIGLVAVFFTGWYILRAMLTLFPRPVPRSYVLAVQSPDLQPAWASPMFLATLGVAVVALSLGLVGLWQGFAAFLGPVFSRPDLAVARPQVSGITWLIVPLLVALAGWGVGNWLVVRSGSRAPAWSEWVKTLYVFFLNKGYVDEYYDAYVVAPTLRFARWLWREVDVRVVDGLVNGVASLSMTVARWLWRVVDVRIIDRSVDGVAHASVGIAHWLWRVVDVRLIDRSVDGTAKASVGMARWLWRVVDMRGIDRAVNEVGHQADRTGRALEGLEPRMLQHQLLVVLLWLVVAMSVLYWLVFTA